MMQQTEFDLFGIGIGPFNLSIAALAKEVDGLKVGFADKNSSMTWHPGLLLDNARMQTSPLKDMVTAVAPTSPLSFLSYLVSKKKIYAFMAAQMSTISRVEFADYLAWVADQVENLMFDNPVESVEFVADKFLIHSKLGTFKSQHICLGSGKVPHAPKCALPFLGKACIHASQIGLAPRSYAGKTIAVVGGGQTGADVFLNLLKQQWGSPNKVIWISRRPNFQPLDEGVFTDQYFTPSYGDLFYNLSDGVKKQEVSHQKLASDGITQESLNEIYQHLYQRVYIENNLDKWSLKPHRTLINMKAVADGYQLELNNGITNNTELCQVDEVILATGYESKIPAYLEPIKDKIEFTPCGNFALQKEFSVNWQGPEKNRIYVVNAGIHSHGIIEPQLSLAAWRSATIINHVLGASHFDLTPEQQLIDWGALEQNNKLTTETI